MNIMKICNKQKDSKNNLHTCTDYCNTRLHTLYNTPRDIIHQMGSKGII